MNTFITNSEVHLILLNYKGGIMSKHTLKEVIDECKILKGHKLTDLERTMIELAYLNGQLYIKK